MVRVIVVVEGTEAEPAAYRDWRGNFWKREPHVELEPFREWAAAGAVSLAPAGCAAGIIPCECEDYESDANGEVEEAGGSRGARTDCDCAGQFHP